MKKLNVTFENGKTIIDGAPSLLYLSKEGRGIGQLYSNGQPVGKLISLNISAHTNDFATYDIKVAVAPDKEGV